jgi:GNAT superfamily N-acetyltransferase
MIRPATLDDVSRLAEIHIYGWRVAYRGILSDECLYKERQVADCMQLHTRLLTTTSENIDLYDDGIVRGFVIHCPARDTDKPKAWEVGAIYVEPAFKGLGYGQALMGRVEARARELGVAEIVLWALSANTDAHGFYAKCGFMPDGSAKTDPHLQVEEIRFAKRL